MTDEVQRHKGDSPPILNRVEFEKVADEIRLLDPELLEAEDTRLLLELGSQFGSEITVSYGTPAAPKWVSGSVEKDVMMSYHNGGEDGHTSLGARGAGVPRNVLLLAKAVNDAAAETVYDPLMRATAFYAAEAHDRHQLCGRTLLPEGQGEGRGDERLSAEDARDRYLAAAGNTSVAKQVYDNVMATAFNPQTSAQNVDYDAWLADQDNPNLTREILGAELTATADLLGLTGKRGPLAALEYSIESLCLAQKNQIAQERLKAHGLEMHQMGLDQMIDLINKDEVLRTTYADMLGAQSKFFSDFLQYSDKAIQSACGKTIDQLFPGRLQNADILTLYAEALHSGVALQAVWDQARGLAGY